MSAESTKFEKQAVNVGPLLWRLAKSTAGGAGAASFYDWGYNTLKPDTDPTKIKDFTFGLTTAKDLFSGNMTPERKFQTVGNIAFGALGPLGGLKGTLAALGTIPAKDILLKSNELPTQVSDTISTAGNKITEIADAANANQTKLNYILGGLGAGALGIGGLAVAKYLADKKERPAASVKYRLQGRQGDPWSEALVEMPIRNPRLSPKTKEGLEAGIRRQVNKNVKYLSMKRDPNTGRMLTYEDWNRLYGDDMDSSTKNPDEHYTAALDNKYEKAASTREWAEGAGTVTTALGGALAGAYLGSQFGDVAGIPGARVGAALGLMPGVVGKLFGALAGRYTPEQQKEHDIEHAGSEFLIPGYAEYQNARRNPLVNVPTTSIEEEGRGYDEEDDDFGKEASQMPGQPAGNTPPPAPKTPGDQKTAPANNAAQPVGIGDAAKQMPDNPGVNAAKGALANIAGRYGVQIKLPQNNA